MRLGAQIMRDDALPSAAAHTERNQFCRHGEHRTASSALGTNQSKNFTILIYFFMAIKFDRILPGCKKGAAVKGCSPRLHAPGCSAVKPQLRVSYGRKHRLPSFRLLPVLQNINELESPLWILSPIELPRFFWQASQSAAVLQAAQGPRFGAAPSPHWPAPLQRPSKSTRQSAACWTRRPPQTGPAHAEHSCGCRPASAAQSIGFLKDENNLLL
jgi:hypothetical protein